MAMRLVLMVVMMVGFMMGMPGLAAGMYVEVVGFAAAAVIAHGLKGDWFRKSSVAPRTAGFPVRLATALTGRRISDR